MKRDSEESLFVCLKLAQAKSEAASKGRPAARLPSPWGKVRSTSGGVSAPCRCQEP